MAEKMVVCEVSTGVARIILNRPPVNALNLEMIKDVVTAFEPCDGPIRRPVLGGNGIWFPNFMFALLPKADMCSATADSAKGQ
jgi:enoyl-CoA hydratase/carnithine racemase